MSDESLQGAKPQLRNLVRTVGTGFHPDTRFEEYVYTNEPTRRLFSSDEVTELNATLDDCVAILEAEGIDPCAVALPVQRAMLFDQRQASLVR